MSSAPLAILLVTPVWKDSARLAEFGQSLATELATSMLPVRWVVADDGSGLVEISRLRDQIEGFLSIYPAVELYCAESHRGKGAVVRDAWNLDLTADWYAFLDADGSVTAADWVLLMRRALVAGNSVLGIRKRTGDTYLQETLWRGLFHRGFLVAVHTILALRSEDPQCGAKILLGQDYRSIAHTLRENGLAFDSEMLARLVRNGATWLEIPVNWQEKPGGKVSPLRDAWAMIAALWRIRRRLS